MLINMTPPDSNITVGSRSVCACLDECSIVRIDAMEAGAMITNLTERGISYVGLYHSDYSFEFELRTKYAFIIFGPDHISYVSRLYIH